jgi:hypothetical protein
VQQRQGSTRAVLGADDIVDYTHQDFADGSHRYDVIIDIAVNPTLSRLRRALTRTGPPSSPVASTAAP